MYVYNPAPHFGGKVPDICPSGNQPCSNFQGEAKLFDMHWQPTQIMTSAALALKMFNDHNDDFIESLEYLREP